jgi:hypothetical protein
MNEIVSNTEVQESTSEIFEETAEVDYTDQLEIVVDDPEVEADGLDATEQSEAAADPEAETEIISEILVPDSPDLTDRLDHVSQTLDVILFLLIVFVAMWILRSWRTWSVKNGGKI